MFRRALVLLSMLLVASVTVGTEPLPDKLVVLTFDDSAKSHFTIVRVATPRATAGSSPRGELVSALGEINIVPACSRATSFFPDYPPGEQSGCAAGSGSRRERISSSS